MEGARNLVIEGLMEVMEGLMEVMEGLMEVMGVMEGAGYLDLVDILLLLLIGGSHRVQFRVNSAIKAQVDLTTGQD